MESICNFVSQKAHIGDIKYCHFVYETEFEKMTQPFLRPLYYMQLVVKGSGVIRFSERRYEAKPGTLFFTFPHKPYEIDGSGDFTYLYISFDGAGAKALLDEMGINEQNCVFQGYSHVTDFWMNSIRRVNRENSYTLTESVLMYTLSFMHGGAEEKSDRFESILEYIKNNYTDPSLTLKKTADIFFYSEKYFSSLFRRKANIKFTDYLNKLRTENAIR